MIGVYVSVPIACYRKGMAREYLETYEYPPPSTCYGFLLSLVGEVDRKMHVGARVTFSYFSKPQRSVVLRTKWRIKNKKIPPGTCPKDPEDKGGGNRTPDYQQLLTDSRLVIWLDSAEEQPNAKGVPTLESRVRTALDRSTCGQIERFGGLSLGESTHLVNEVSLLDPRASSVSETLGVLADGVNDGFQPRVFLTVEPSSHETGDLITLPVWVDHVGASGTRYVTGHLVDLDGAKDGRLEPPATAKMPKIESPTSEA